MNAQAETQSLSLEYDLPHPPAKVWRALTEPELLAKRVMANDMRPSVGHAFTFRSEPTPWWESVGVTAGIESAPQQGGNP